MKTIVIHNPETATSGDICECRIPVAHMTVDHPLLAPLIRVERRCSVCDQIWDDVPVSRHERCAKLFPDGARRYADCNILGVDREGYVTIQVED